MNDTFRYISSNINSGLGIVEIGIVDDDTVTKSNLQRQILYYEDEYS